MDAVSSLNIWLCFSVLVFKVFDLVSHIYYEYRCSACMYVCMRVCLCTPCVPGVYRGQKRTLDALELELQMVENYHALLGPLEEQPKLLTIELSL